MNIFKANDIRGVYPEQVNENIFFRIGSAAAMVLSAKTVAVGRDARNSSPQLADAVIRGLRQAGVQVFNLGVTSTPQLYFATAHYKCDGGIQITASHNPAHYNGIKICRAGAMPMSYETGLEAIEQLVMSAKDAVAGTAAGEVIVKSIRDEYLTLLARYADGINPFTVVADAGNGVMGEFLPALFAKLPCELLPLYFAPDGDFPNHEPNPLEERNLRELSAKVKEMRADLGVAFDGDGDRVVFVDENGEAIAGDLITALLAREILLRQPGVTILYDLRSSRVVKEVIEKHGGVSRVSRVGHSYIKQQMREQDAVFAGELSGHFYFREISFTDNAEIAMLAVLRAISRERKKLSEIIASLRRYYATGEINFNVGNPQAKLAAVADHYQKLGGEITYLDGVSVDFPDWWFNLRSSNTEPLLRLNLEANTADLRDQQRQEIEKLIFG